MTSKNQNDRNIADSQTMKVIDERLAENAREIDEAFSGKIKRNIDSYFPSNPDDEIDDTTPLSISQDDIELMNAIVGELTKQDSNKVES
jgi:hypothetical protein